MTLEDKFIGCLLGLAVGDALGSHFEGQPQGWLRKRFPSPEALLENLPEARWHYTDDTQMAIGVAEALLKDQEIVESTLCNAFVMNYVPSRGYGRGARAILDTLANDGDYRTVAENMFPGGSYGNGAAMRVAPIGLFFHHDLDRVCEQAHLSSLPTHVHPLGIEGAKLIASAVALCIRNDEFDKTYFFGELQSRSKSPEFQTKLRIASTIESADDLIHLGNGIEAQESAVTAIACFALWPDSYEQVVSNAILLGGDTDTIAAMAGAISGAHLGVDAIPKRLLTRVEDDYKGRSFIADLARKLCFATVS